MRTKLSAAAVGVAVLGAVGLAGPSQAVAGAPDLVVTAVGVSPQAVTAGTPVAFRATIKNQGTAATPAGVVHGVGFGVGGRTVTWSDTFTTSLAPGASVTLTANGGPAGARWSVPAGTSTVTAHVDDARRIAESNEANNTRVLTVTAAPNLSVRLRGARVVVAAAPSAQETAISNRVTGSAYGACFGAGGMVQGTETYIGEYGAGPGTYPFNGPFVGSGEGRVPASAIATTTVTNVVDVNEIAKWNYGAPMALPCPAGAQGAFTYLHAKQLVTKRHALDGRVLASVTTAVDADLPFLTVEP